MAASFVGADLGRGGFGADLSVAELLKSVKPGEASAVDDGWGDGEGDSGQYGGGCEVAGAVSEAEGGRRMIC